MGKLGIKGDVIPTFITQYDVHTLNLKVTVHLNLITIVSFYVQCAEVQGIVQILTDLCKQLCVLWGSMVVKSLKVG